MDFVGLTSPQWGKKLAQKLDLKESYDHMNLAYVGNLKHPGKDSILLSYQKQGESILEVAYTYSNLLNSLFYAVRDVARTLGVML